MEVPIMKKNRRGNYLLGMFFAVLGAVILIVSAICYEYMGTYSLGSGFFPSLVGAALILLAAASLFETAAGKYDAADVDMPAGREWRRILLFLALTLGMGLSIQFLGMMISICCFLFLELHFIEKQRLFFSAVSAVLITSVIYIVFGILLKVNMPTGIFGF